MNTAIQPHRQHAHRRHAELCTALDDWQDAAWHEELPQAAAVALSGMANEVLALSRLCGPVHPSWYDLVQRHREMIGAARFRPEFRERLRAFRAVVDRLGPAAVAHGELITDYVDAMYRRAGKTPPARPASHTPAPDDAELVAGLLAAFAQQVSHNAALIDVAVHQDDPNAWSVELTPDALILRRGAELKTCKLTSTPQRELYAHWRDNPDTPAKVQRRATPARLVAALKELAGIVLQPFAHHAEDPKGTYRCPPELRNRLK